MTNWTQNLYNIAQLRPISTNDLIRFGRKRDGGYVLNKRLLGHCKFLYAFGVSSEWSFEADFKKYANKNLEIHAFDISTHFFYFLATSLKFFKQVFLFDKKSIFSLLLAFHYILVAVRYIIFFKLRTNVFFHKKGVQAYQDDRFTTFDVLFREKSKKSLFVSNSVFVKLDIEGTEFDVLPAMLNFSEIINGFVVEFHDLDEHAEFDSIIELIKKKGFVITHIHVNNNGGLIPNTIHPRLLEISFAQKSLFSEDELSSLNTKQYPIDGIDHPCVIAIPDIRIKF